MYDNDYIIAFDENGEPYIAHAFGDRARAAWGSIKGTGHKYIDKVKTASGKIRYIYPYMRNKAKGAAKRAWGSKAGRFIDSHDAGISERLMSRAYARKSKRAGKKGNNALSAYYNERSNALREEGRRETGAATMKALATGQRAYVKAKGAPAKVKAAAAKARGEAGAAIMKAMVSGQRAYAKANRRGKTTLHDIRTGTFRNKRRAKKKLRGVNTDLL